MLGERGLPLWPAWSFVSTGSALELPVLGSLGVSLFGP